jgi:hypothetical protein
MDDVAGRVVAAFRDVFGYARAGVGADAVLEAVTS